ECIKKDDGYLDNPSPIEGVEDDYMPTAPNPEVEEEEEFDESQRKPIWWYHSDHLGSSSYLTDNFGRPTHYYDQLPFGESMVEHNQSQYYGNQYKFNGKELDVATGMYYYGARYYDPRLSIFISVDPLAEQTFEPYSYTGNNPIMFTDPTGMSKEGGGDPLYKIYVRSFISASRAGNDPLGRHFRGDGRVASTRDSGPNLSGATSRASVTLGWYSPIQKSKLLAKDSDMTVRYPAYGIEGAQKKPTVNAS